MEEFHSVRYTQKFRQNKKNCLLLAAHNGDCDENRHQYAQRRRSFSIEKKKNRVIWQVLFLHCLSKSILWYDRAAGWLGGWAAGWPGGRPHVEKKIENTLPAVPLLIGQPRSIHNRFGLFAPFRLAGARALQRSLTFYIFSFKCCAKLLILFFERTICL